MKKLWCCISGEYNKIIWFYQGRRGNARNVSFRISLRWPIHIINPVDKIKLSSHNNTIIILLIYHQSTDFTLYFFFYKGHVQNRPPEQNTEINEQCNTKSVKYSFITRTPLGIARVCLLRWSRTIFATTGGCWVIASSCSIL